jgi:hypothetical protein
MIAWVFMSPKRLVLTLIGMVAVLIVAALLLATLPKDAPAPAVKPAPVLTAEAAMEVAQAWTDARMVMEDGQTPTEWLAVVTDLSTPQMDAELAQVDPTQLPGTRAYGLPTVRSLGETTAVVSVPVVGQDRINVTVVVHEGRLLVDAAALPTLPSVVDW